MSNAFVLPKQVPLNSAGRVYPGAKAYFYRTGTNTPKQVFQDAAHATPFVQPVEADLGGTFPVVYLDTSDFEYRVTLKTSGDALIYTTDNVGGRLTQDEFDAFLANVTAVQLGQVLYFRTAAELAAGVTPTDYSRQPGDLLRYGLSTGASATVNSAAVNNAFLSNSNVFCDVAGTYVCDDVLFLQSNLTVHLAQGVILQPSVKLWGTPFMRGNTKSNIRIHGGVLDGNKAANPTGTIIGLALFDCTDVKVVGMVSQNFPSDNVANGAQGDGFYIGGTTGAGCTKIEMLGCTSTANVRQGLSIVRCDGVDVIGGSYSGTTGNNPGAGIDIEANPAAGDARNVRLIGVLFDGNYAGVILTESSFNVTVIGCQILNSRAWSLLLSDVTNANIVGNYMKPAMTVSNPIVDVVSSENVIFSSNIIEGEGAASSFEGAGIRFAVGGVNISITKNIFKTTKAQAISLGNSALSGVPTLITFSDNTMIDCVDSVASPTAGVIGVGGNTVTSKFPLIVTLRNNIIYDTRGTPAGFGIKMVNIPIATSANYRIDGNRNIGPTSPFDDNIATVPPLCGLVTWNPGNLVDGAGETSPDITVTGAALGDSVEVYEPYAIGDCIAKGSVKSANTCVIRLQNESGGAAFDGASGSWRVRVRKLLQA